MGFFHRGNVNRVLFGLRCHQRRVDFGGGEGFHFFQRAFIDNHAFADIGDHHHVLVGVENEAAAGGHYFLV